MATGNKASVKIESGEFVCLRITDQNGTELKFTISRRKPLTQLMEEYCKTTNISLSNIRFRLDTGEAFWGKDTAAGLGLVDGDILEVFSDQDGGR